MIDDELAAGDEKMTRTAGWERKDKRRGCEKPGQR